MSKLTINFHFQKQHGTPQSNPTELKTDSYSYHNSKQKNNYKILKYQ